jgi:hypothetical protein
VELVREQVVANLPPAAGYDLTPEGLVLWLDRRGGRSVTYDLRAGRRYAEPREPDGLRASEGLLLDVDRLVFARVPLLWRQWVAAWEQDQAGTGHVRLFDARLEPIPVDGEKGTAASLHRT